MELHRRNVNGKIYFNFFLEPEGGSRAWSFNQGQLLSPPPRRRESTGDEKMSQLGLLSLSLTFAPSRKSNLISADTIDKSPSIFFSFLQINSLFILFMTKFF